MMENPDALEASGDGAPSYKRPGHRADNKLRGTEPPPTKGRAIGLTIDQKTFGGRSPLLQGIASACSMAHVASGRFAAYSVPAPMRLTSSSPGNPNE